MCNVYPYLLWKISLRLEGGTNHSVDQGIYAIWYFQCLLEGASRYWLKLYKVTCFWPIDFMFSATNFD